jgi:hypothetical protein
MVLRLDGLFAIYQCLSSSSGSNIVKFAAGAILNLSLMSKANEMICTTGGLVHVMNALQRCTNMDTAGYILKTMINLVEFKSPLIKLLFVELGYSESILELVSKWFHT